MHTHSQTINNPLPNKLLRENRLLKWINTETAKQMGISDGDLVEVSAEYTPYPATITDFIHPEAVFTFRSCKDRLDQRLKPACITMCTTQALKPTKLEEVDLYSISPYFFTSSATKICLTQANHYTLKVQP